MLTLLIIICVTLLPGLIFGISLCLKEKAELENVKIEIKNNCATIRSGNFEFKSSHRL